MKRKENETESRRKRKKFLAKLFSRMDEEDCLDEFFALASEKESEKFRKEKKDEH